MTGIEAGASGWSGCTFKKLPVIILALALLPLALWLVGTVMVRMAPPVYQSEAVLRLPAGGASTSNPVTNPAVLSEAASALAAGSAPNPMAAQMLRAQLTLHSDIGPGMIRIAARGQDPQEARRTLLAVVKSYEHQHATGPGSPMLVYAAPLESAPVGVPHGMRVVLGCAGLALAGLILSIPLLLWLEGVPVLQSGREFLSATARACAAAGLPRASGYLPAAQPAG